MNEVVMGTAMPQPVWRARGFENEHQYQYYLKVKQSMRRMVPVGIAS